MVKGKKSKLVGHSSNNQLATNENSTNQPAQSSTVNESAVERPVVEQNQVHDPVSNQHSIEHANIVSIDTELIRCASCGLDTGGYIVQCDDCLHWHHFECVGLDEIGEEDPWSCNDCLSQPEQNGSHQSNVRQSNNESRSQSNRHNSMNTETNSQRQGVPSGTKVNTSSQSIRQGEIPISSVEHQDVLNTSIQTQNRLSNSFTRFENAKSSTVLRDNPQSSRILEPEDERQVFHPVIRNTKSMEQIVDDSRKVPSVTVSLPLTSTKDQSVKLYPVNGASHQEPVINDNVSQGQRTSKVSHHERAISIKSTSSKSSKTISSRKSRRDLEQIRLQEEFRIQKELDEEKIKIQLQALEMKEVRERRFLEERLKTMEEESSENGSHVTGHTTKTKRSNKSEVSHKTERITSWVKGQYQQLSQATPADLRIRRLNSKIDEFNFDFSIPVEDHELKSLKKKFAVDNTDTNNGPEKLNVENQSIDLRKSTVNLKPVNRDAEPFSQGQRKVILSKEKQPQVILNRDTNSQQPISQRMRFQQQDGQETYARRQINQDERPFTQNLLDENNIQQSTNNGVGNPRSTTVNLPPSANSNYHEEPVHYEQPIKSTYDQSGKQIHPTYQHNQEFSFPSNNQSHQLRPPPYQTQRNMQQQSNSFQQSNGFQQSILQNIGSMHQFQSQSNQVLPISHQQNTGFVPMNQGQQSYSSSYQPNAVPNTDESQIRSQAVFDSVQVEEQRPPLTANQIAARHVVTRKLPHFYGNPAEWPEFIQKFNNTTIKCGLDNSENLDRLRECLKSPAKDIVRSQLSMPHCVPSIIETLAQKYGRPEIVVRAILKEIRAEPPIKADKLETLSNFGYKVQNAVETIKEQKLQFYLYNPELVQELVDKLPHQTKIEWARHADQLPEVTVAALSEWLVQLSRTLNRITVPEISINSGDRKSERKSENSKDTDNSWLNTHGVSKSQESDENSTCLSCSKSCKNLSECPKFKGLTVEARWKFIYDNNKICRGCLRAHGRKCTELKECGVKGCTFKHHPILHKDKKHSEDETPVQPPNEKNESTNDMSESDGSCNTHRGGRSVFYKIVPVKLKSRKKTVHTLAYMDDGSGLTLLENELAEELGLIGVPESLCLRWTSGTIRHEKESMRVDLEISDAEESQHNHPMRDVRTVKLLDPPMQKINRESLIEKYPYLERVPFQEFEGKPRILIGLDNVKFGLSREYVEGGMQEPVVSKTLLGWVVHGPNGPTSKAENQLMQHHVLNISCNECTGHIDKDQPLHKQVKKVLPVSYGLRTLISNMESEDFQLDKKVRKITNIRENCGSEPEVIHGKIGKTRVKITTKVRPVAKLAGLDVATKEVKPIEDPVIKCLNKGENVTDSNSNDITDMNSSLANIGMAVKSKNDSRKPSIPIRRSNRIATKSKVLHNSDKS